MKNKKLNTKSILSILMCLVLVATVFVGCSTHDGNDITTTTKTTEKTTEKTTSARDKSTDDFDVTISKDTIQSAKDTSKALASGEDLASNEIADSSIEEEGKLEPDATVAQENISYDGTNSKKGLNLIGSYQGLMYFNQGDPRWGKKLYTSTGNRSQTIKSSGCGPTSAAMVVSSSKGLILPPTMCKLFVDNGFRTANNGTAWKAFSFVADFFDFKFYKETRSFDEALKYMKTDKDKNGVSDYFTIMSCGSGLWTTSGHYVVWIDQSGKQSAIYDPYLYNGKFNTASRRAAKVTVSGNTAYVSSSNLHKYSNAMRYFIFSNDQTGKKAKPSSKKSATTKVKYTRYVSTQDDKLNVRSGPSTKYNIVGSLSKGTKVTVTAVSNGFSKIGNNKWVSSSYLSATKPNSTKKPTKPSKPSSYKTTVGKTYKLKSDTTLYSKSNLSGTKYQYIKDTPVKVLSHVSSTVDYIYIAKTKRHAYCSVSNLSTSSKSTKTKTKTSTVGKYKVLKQDCTLYSKSNLTGTKYQYYKDTKVKILKNVTNKVDQVLVVKTGRKAYISVRNYK